MQPLVRAGGLRGYVALMHALGADPSALLRRHRIKLTSLDDEDTLLSLRDTTRLLEASASATQCPDFGLRLSASQDISVLGHLAIAMQNAQTLADALEMAARYLFLHSPGMSVTALSKSTVVDEAFELRFSLSIPGLSVTRQTMDVCLGDLHRIVKLLAGKHYALLAVALPHHPVAPLSAYTQFFGAKVLVAQAHGGLHLSRRMADLRLDGNPALRQLAMDYLSQHVGDAGQSLTMRVRKLLERTLSTEQGSKSAVAQVLNMHPRTLARYLAAERTSFEQIRDAIQQDIARRYLCETRMPLTRLASLMGHSEQAVLTRACHRWFGMSPSALRKLSSQPAPVAAAGIRSRPAPRTRSVGRSVP